MEQRKNFAFVVDETSTEASIRQFMDLFASFNIRHSRLYKVVISENIPIPFSRLLLHLGDLLSFLDPHLHYSSLQILLPEPETTEILNLLLERRAFFKQVEFRITCAATLPYLQALEAYGRLERLILRDWLPEAAEVLRNLCLQDQFEIFDGADAVGALHSIEIGVFQRVVEKWLTEERPKSAKFFRIWANFDLTPLEGVLKRANTQLPYDALGRRHGNCDAAAIAAMQNGVFTLYFVNDHNEIYDRNDRFVCSDEYRY